MKYGLVIQLQVVLVMGYYTRISEEAIKGRTKELSLHAM